MVKLESLENPSVVPVMINCKNDKNNLINSSIPHVFQENATFILDLDNLPNQRAMFTDENGIWTMKGSLSNCTLLKRRQTVK